MSREVFLEMWNEPNILVASARRWRAMALGEKAVDKLVKRSVVETAEHLLMSRGTWHCSALLSGAPPALFDAPPRCGDKD
jgi:hypothetical protein